MPEQKGEMAQFNPLVILFQILVFPLQAIIQIIQRLPQSSPFLLTSGNIQPTPKTTYSNLEEWEVVRDINGMISKVIIHREATKNE